jgi:hypothetical protein
MDYHLPGPFSQTVSTVGLSGMLWEGIYWYRPFFYIAGAVIAWLTAEAFGPLAVYWCRRGWSRSLRQGRHR